MASASAISSVWAWTSPRAGTGGRNRIVGTAGSRTACGLLRNSGVLRASERAGIRPEPDHVSELSMRYRRNALLARMRLSSGALLLNSTSWWEFAHTAGFSPIVGRADMVHGRSGAVLLRSLICQMPSQV